MNVHSYRTLLLAALSGLALAGCLSVAVDPPTAASATGAATASVARPADRAAPAKRAADASVVIPFTLSAQNNLVVDARIDDGTSLRLMLHTASSDITLTEDAVRRLEGIAFGNRTRVQSWGGSADARSSPGHRLQVGGWARDGLTLWENKNSGEGTDGKFGLDFFGGSPVEIDFDRSRIVVHRALPDNAKRYEALPIDSENGDLFVQGVCRFAGETRTQRFLIHSGYGGGLLLDDAFAESSGIGGKIAITETSKLSDSYGNIIEVKKGVMPGFSLGHATLADVPVGFFSGAIGRQRISVIGGAVLSRFNLIFDPADRKLYVKPREAKAAS